MDDDREQLAARIEAAGGPDPLKVVVNKIRTELGGQYNPCVTSKDGSKVHAIYSNGWEPPTPMELAEAKAFADGWNACLSAAAIRAGGA